SVDAEATDLALLGRTFGNLSGSRVPPLAGSGRLRLEAAGPLRHPGVSAEGTFASLRVADTRVRALKLSVHMADVNRVLDANAQITAQELRLSNRVMKPVELTLLTRGRALDLHAGIGGAPPPRAPPRRTPDRGRPG